MDETPVSLRDGLIKAGIDLLDQGGIAALTLRRAAARAGVSHAAPAHHFDGLPGLLTAIAAQAFAIFAHTMQVKIATAGPDPLQRLICTCEGYLDFANMHKGLFHLMFISPEVNRDHPDLVPNARLSYLLLRQNCLPFAPPGATEDPALETAVWSMVHGYAMLGFTHVQGRRTMLAIVPDFAVLLRELLAGRINA